MLRRFSRAFCLPALLVAALFAAGCGGGGRSSTADENKDGDTKPKKDQPPISPMGPDLRAVKPDFTLTASELGTEEKNGVPIREKYKGKVIELSGVVRWIRRDRENRPDLSDRIVLWLYGATKSPVDMLRCVARDPTPWKEVTPGQTVKIKGKSPEPGYWGDIHLLDCVIVEATGPHVPSFTADQVSREYRADPVGFSKKYEENGFILGGEIARVDVVEERQRSVLLKTPDGGPRVVCHFLVGNLAESEVRQLKRGQKIKVLCETGTPRERDEVELAVYLLMEKAD
jgi:hypothetical protein